MTTHPAALPLFGDAYLADTQHLTLEEHGAYLKLLLIAWRSPDCALPDDDKRIATMLGIAPAKWAKLKPTVMQFWTRTRKGWEQKRLSKERKFVDEKSQKNSRAAKSRWEDKPLKSGTPAHANGDADAHANGDAPPPPPISKNNLSSQTSTPRGRAAADLPSDASPPAPGKGAAPAQQSRLASVAEQVRKRVAMTSLPADVAIVRGWLADGIDPEKTIYPVADKVGARGKSVRTYGYLDQAVREAHAARSGADDAEIKRLRRLAEMYGENPSLTPVGGAAR